jgi:hypothetical protein
LLTKLIAAVLLSTSTIAFAETLPNAPEPVSTSAAPMIVASARIQPHAPHFNKFDYALYAGVFAYHIGDFISTERNLDQGGRELMLPQALVSNKPAFAAYSVGLAALEVGSSIYLHRHGHEKLARLGDTLSVSSGGAVVAWNLSHSN